MDKDVAETLKKLSNEDLIRLLTVERATYMQDVVVAAESEMASRKESTTKTKELSGVFASITHHKLEQDALRPGAWIRFLHFVVDKTTVLFISAVLNGVAFTLIGDSSFLRFLFGAISGSPIGSLDPNVLMSGVFVFVAFNAISFVGYYLIMESVFQKTLGKFLTRTRVILRDGRKPSVATILLRTLSRFFPFDAFMYLFLVDGIHDYLSRTIVVKEKDNEKYA